MRLGERLGERFEIEQTIGSGGMGTVFRARDPISGEAVAVKVISSQQSHVTERFTREVRVLAELSHPGVVRYISHGTTSSGELFLVMEWLDGETVKSRLQRGPLTASEAITLATRVAEALGAAHARGVVHRDLKPSNLFLPGGRIDQVKLLDFGIARREGKTQLTQTGMMIGTPGYMAPEQARASGQIDARADVFALGCVLFQCLTGAPPFDGDTAAAILAKILFGTAPRVSELWPDAPSNLDGLVAQMLAKDAALRPSDGANLAAALAALGPVPHSLVAAHRPAAGPRAAAGERRLLAVVMLSPTAQDDGLTDDPLRHAVVPHGGRLEHLADGSTVVLLDAGHQVATDHAAQAARCALAMGALAGPRPLAIAMGRTEAGNRLPEADVIDRASRLLAHIAPRPGHPPPIVLDDVSAGLLDARFDVIEHDSQLRLRGERAVMQGARTLLGRPTSCVGRDWELAALAGLLDEAIEESAARVVVVTAAAGMGKSRLGAEFIGRVRDRHPEIAIWIGRGDSLRAGSTLDLLAQALRGALGIHEGEPPSARHDKLRARVAASVPPADRDRVAAFLGELVGASVLQGPGDDSGAGAALRAARQDAQLMSELMRNAWLDFLQAETSARPVVLVLDDLHWGDFGTVRFIDAALRDRGKRPWMVLALARPEVYEVFPRLWADRQNAQELRLKELGRKAGERLVRQVLGDAVGNDTVEHLVKQADGNAFYLEELIRAVAEGKDRSGPLPATVLAMVETRLGRLPHQARRALRAASVFGDACWDSGVAALLDGATADPEVGEWLAQLVEQEVLVARPDSRFPGERELAFRHALLREGAYATLTTDDARLMHRLAGEWLAQHGESDPMVLAGHFQRGGEPARAAGFYLRAAEQALQVLDNEAAFARTGLGLACDPPPELRITLLGVHCYASLLVRRVALTGAEELLRSAPRGSVPWTQALFAYSLGTMMVGRIEDSLGALALLREVTPAPEASGWMSLVFLSAMSILDRLGQVPQGTALEEPFFALVRARGDQDAIVRLGWHYAVGLRASYAHDDPWRALQHSEALQGIYDMIGGETVFLSRQLLRGMNLWYLGAAAGAAHALEEIPAADMALGLSSADRRCYLSWLYAERGALDAARALATQLIESSHALQDYQGEGRGRWALAEVLRRMGDLEAADREIERALALAMPLDQPGALATRSAIRLAQGRAGDALAAADDAMARCDAMGGCGMYRGAAVRLAHAEALHATGADEAARRAIADARARQRAIADRIADPAYQASFLGQVPENARTLALAAAWLGDTVQG